MLVLQRGKELKLGLQKVKIQLEEGRLKQQVPEGV